jgi:hypothetical protein
MGYPSGVFYCVFGSIAMHDTTFRAWCPLYHAVLSDAASPPGNIHICPQQMSLLVVLSLLVFLLYCPLSHPILACCANYVTLTAAPSHWLCLRQKLGDV